MGIYLRRKTYWARWAEKGKQRRESLKTQDLAVAQRRYRALTGRPLKTPTEKPEPRFKGLTMKQVLSGWFQYQKSRCKPRSRKVYRTVGKRFDFMWGKLRPEQITTRQVEETQESLLSIGLSPRTINFQIAHALSALRWAKERGLTDAELPKWKRLKIHTRRTRKYVSTPELERLLNKVQERKWKRLEVVLMLALYAGLRQQEIAWLTWDDVDLDSGWIHVQPKRGWTPKSSSSERSIPLTADLRDFLNEHPRSFKWVAEQRPERKWSSTTIGTECRKLFRAAKVDDGGPHTLHRLRGTFATQVLRSGGDLESLREILGHSILSVTAGYLTATSESKRQAVGGVRFGR